MENVTSTQEILASSEECPCLDLAHLEQSLSRIAHRAPKPDDRRRVLRTARSVIDAIQSRMPNSVVAARCESLIIAAAMLVKKVEAKGSSVQ